MDNCRSSDSSNSLRVWDSETLGGQCTTAADNFVRVLNTQGRFPRGQFHYPLENLKLIGHSEKNRN
jgi:hypothetical protein